MRSQRSTQALWNTWQHCGSSRTFSPRANCSRQIAHSLTCSQPSITQEQHLTAMPQTPEAINVFVAHTRYGRCWTECVALKGV